MTQREFLRDAFIRYTGVSSQSNRHQTTLPTSEGQMELALLLRNELHNLGVTDIVLQDDSILIAKIPGNTVAPAISFIAHLDTVDIGASPHVHAHVVSFTGNDFYLDDNQTILFKVEDYPHIKNYKGDDIIVTDGTSVLGADDKAGVTVMVGIARHLMLNAIPHGDVYLVFVPDEEIGLRGAKTLDIDTIPVEFSYTIDGNYIGSFNYETFNAASALITIKGVSIHPGRAKNVLVNPVLVAQDLISRFDVIDTPEHTDGYEGYFYFMETKANPMEAVLDLNIRDFDLKKFEERKQFVQNTVNQVQAKYPKAEISLEIQDVYANIGNYLSQDSRPIELVEKSMTNLGIEIVKGPLRGGTDGSVLSSKGRMTPNIFTGSHNIHSIFEYLPLTSLEKSLANTLEMIRLLVEEYR
ncbi:MAG: peptidase T [Brevinema sp.]